MSLIGTSKGWKRLRKTGRRGRIEGNIGRRIWSQGWQIQEDSDHLYRQGLDKRDNQKAGIHIVQSD